MQNRRRKAATYRVRHLTDHEHAVLLSLSSHALEGLKTLALERRIDRDNRISCGFKVIVLEHYVSRQDETNLALTPSFVGIDELLRRHTTGRQILRVP